VVGFAETPDVGALAGLAHRAGIPLVHDVGSGLLRRTRGVPREEPAVTESLAAGADLVCFSGDKLLGGPQAGIVVGTRRAIQRLRRHPIARAVRLDGMTVAALETVLGMYARGRREDLPAWRFIDAGTGELRARARRVADELPGSAVMKGESVAGGGSLPGYGLPTSVVRLPVARAQRLAARLRVGNPPVFCRVDGDALLFDLRTVDPGEEDRLIRAVRYAISQEG
jgi:L-seryl-tRNA(Ser) seleniumtransferase